MQIDLDGELFICPDVHEPDALVGWNYKDFILGEPEFYRWSPKLLAIRYDSLFKWIKVWSLPLHLWTMEIFSVIGRICGGLASVDPFSSSCGELRWVRLELLEGDLRNIPRQLAMTDDSKYYPVLITIEGEIAVVDHRNNDGDVVADSTSSAPLNPTSHLEGKGVLNFESNSKLSSC